MSSFYVYAESMKNLQAQWPTILDKRETFSLLRVPAWQEGKEPRSCRLRKQMYSLCLAGEVVCSLHKNSLVFQLRLNRAPSNT